MNRFEQLVQDIKDVLGPSSGITSDDVDVEDLTHIMERYISDKKEWSMYAMEDGNLGYTRNLVDEGNGKANLVGFDLSSLSNSFEHQAQTGTDPTHQYSSYSSGPPEKEAPSTTTAMLIAS